jgi:hypothetical protein
MPEFAIDPGGAGDKAVRLDGSKDIPCLAIDLVDLAPAIVTGPDGLLRSGEPRVPAAARCRNHGEHNAGFWIDLLDSAVAILKEMLAAERSSRMRRDIHRAHGLSTGGIRGVELVTRGKPDVLTVIGNAIHAVCALQWAIFAEDFGLRSLHSPILIVRLRQQTANGA